MVKNSNIQNAIDCSFCNNYSIIFLDEIKCIWNIISDIFLSIAFQLIWEKILLTFYTYTHWALWDVGKILHKLPKSEVNKSNTVLLLPFWFSIKPILSGHSVWNKKKTFTHLISCLVSAAEMEKLQLWDLILPVKFVKSTTGLVINPPTLSYFKQVRLNFNWLRRL